MWADRLCHTRPENSGGEALARRLLGRGGPRLRANLRHDLRYAVRDESPPASPMSPNPRIPCGARTRSDRVFARGRGIRRAQGTRGPTAKRPRAALADWL